MTRRTAARPAQGSDHGTPERRQHAGPGAIVEETAEATVSGQVIARRVRIRPPVECMGLGDDLVAAAIRFRDDYDMARGIRPPEQPDDGKGPTMLPIIRGNVATVLPSDMRLDAMQRLGRAREAMGPTHYVVTRVVCDEIGLSDLGRMLGRNRQELAGVLKCGLEALVEMRERRAA